MHAYLRIVLFALGAASCCAPASQSQPVGADADPMLRCARMPDAAAQIRCFDEVKRGRSRNSVKADVRRDPVQAVLGPSPDRGADESRYVDRYAEEIARELGKEMYLEDYPRRAREEGRGGTTELLLRVDADARLTDLSVARSSGYADLDQFALNKVSKLKLPRVPKAIRSSPFTVHLPITFAIRSPMR